MINKRLILATNNNPQVGGTCNWLTAKLQPDSSSNLHFLQCTAENAGETCGTWMRTPCSPGTIFNHQLQICIPVSLQCQQKSSVPICGCRNSDIGQACPGKSSCEQSVCCQSVGISSTAFQIQAAPPLCIGSGAYPISSCDRSCPPSKFPSSNKQ